MRFSRVHLAPMLSNATRLQLGNIKTKNGTFATASGSQEKWGFILGGRVYPIIGCTFSCFTIIVVMTVAGTYQEYRDMILMSEHISYEDVKDRCLTPIPGWARLRSLQMASPMGPVTYRDPTPLEWLPFELKLGYVKQASY
ncbi:unnamed protein product [Phytomonas sp. Hart1]|nr:unnamed protein product [Phytomonas sp. Hart1]|eukprot:CCW72271.1 unnamed protein product [Phytomonas sp. isolate Hart1]